MISKAVILLCFATCGIAQELPTAQLPHPPSPITKRATRENLKFTGAVLFFGSSTLAQVLAQHSGAKKCKVEDARAGQPQLFGTSDGYGHRPDAADVRELGVTAGLYIASGIAKALHRPVVARRILIVGGLVQYGEAGATWWATCN